jgi:large subunit ribosomal protein L7Ae
MGVPYTIVKGKARLGAVVGRKTSSVVSFQPLLLPFTLQLSSCSQLTMSYSISQLAFGEVKSEDTAELAKLVSAIKSNYTDKNAEARKVWGGGHRGHKSMFISSLSSMLSSILLLEIA